jgi:hypothetical protein
MEFIQDIWEFMRTRKKFWLFPALIVLVILGAILVVGSTSAVAPFIYTIF